MTTLAIAALLAFTISAPGLIIIFASPIVQIPFVAGGFLVLLLTLQVGEIAKRERPQSTTTIGLIQAVPCLVLVTIMVRVIWQFRTFAG